MTRRPKSLPERAPRGRPAPRTARSTPSPAGRIWLYGQHAVAAALANPDRPCYRLLATEAALPGVEPAAKARDARDRERCRPSALASSCRPTRRTRAWPLDVGPLPERDLAELGDAERSLVLALDQVSDPRNLGAILRTAAALGVAACCCRSGAVPS